MHSAGWSPASNHFSIAFAYVVALLAAHSEVADQWWIKTKWDPGLEKIGAFFLQNLYALFESWDLQVKAKKSTPLKRVRSV